MIMAVFGGFEAINPDIFTLWAGERCHSRVHDCTLVAGCARNGNARKLRFMALLCGVVLVAPRNMTMTVFKI